MSTISPEAYFAAHPAPPALDDTRQRVRASLEHNAAQRPVVVITSGGTTVPLERNTVRFIDNFSVGTRGAASAELRRGR